MRWIIPYFRTMKTLLLFGLILTPYLLCAQSKMIIYFDDVKSTETVVFSERAMKRREKNSVEIDQRDFKVNEKYLEKLKEFGTVLNVSRWLHAVSFETSVSPEQLRESCSFIKSIVPIIETGAMPRKDIIVPVEDKILNYGVADTQVRQIGADCLHDMGFKGTGVYLALIDAGFKGLDTVSFFDFLYAEGRLLDSHDYISNLNIYDYSGHGTAVASCIFGEKIGAVPYAGTAIDVDVALYVTENVFIETLQEEFDLVTALERCDSVGVDIASISLGYVDFDDPLQNHTYGDMDGNTTIAAVGVNVAFSKGIIVTSAAGNSGPSFISTPCDADDGLCVGAVNNQGDYAFFSSVGPSADGQVKPDIAATGWNTWVVLEDGQLVMGNGTSFATPVMAGGIACLIQANPSNTAGQIMDAVKQSASQFLTPDEFLGYGIPQLCVANDSLVAWTAGLTDIEDPQIELYPNPCDQSFNISTVGIDSVELVNELGQKMNVNWEAIDDKTYRMNTSSLASGVYSVRINDSAKAIRLVVIH